MSTHPRSPYDETSGLAYFPRMLDKIRLHARGELARDCQANLGKGVDGHLCNFLRLGYEALKTRALEGGTDEELLAWCEAQARPLSAIDRRVWNAFVTKLGWNDVATPYLREFKATSGLAERDDILTMADYIEVDEGRKP